MDLLSSYNIRFCFSGHDHRGNTAYISQTGFYTMKGMLDGPAEVPFAVVEVDGSDVRIHGFGGEISRGLF